jgi:hypothetical protein
MGIPTKEDICTFVKNACSSTSNSELYLCTINSDIAERVKKIIPITLTNYDVVITEEYVRHVKNGHKDDLEYICLIPEIISNFDKVSKSIEPNRRTKRTEIFIVFEKRYSDDTVKLVN